MHKAEHCHSFAIGSESHSLTSSPSLCKLIFVLSRRNSILSNCTIGPGERLRLSSAVLTLHGSWLYNLEVSARDQQPVPLSLSFISTGVYCIITGRKLEQDAATTQLAHGHNYEAHKCPCANYRLLLHFTPIAS